MLSIFFLSYDEPDVDDNFKKLSERYPHIQRVHGIEGIHNAHKECARRSLTNNFFVIDADTEVYNNFNPDFEPEESQKFFTHIWNSKNLLNGLIYGNGGIKLFHKEKVLSASDIMPLDFSQSIAEIIIVNKVISGTRFNSSPFCAWRAAFRECSKLASMPFDEDSKKRLAVWRDKDCYNRYEPFWGNALGGANEGKLFGEQYIHSRDKLSQYINDYEWLKRYYNDPRT